MAATNRDFIDQLDAAIGCQQCGGPLGDSPSDDFCGEGCQERWHATRPRRLAGPWKCGPVGIIPGDAFDAASSGWQEIGQVREPVVFGFDPAVEGGAVVAAALRGGRIHINLVGEPAPLSAGADHAGVTPGGEVIGRDNGRLRAVDHVVERTDTDRAERGAFESALANTIAEIGRAAGIPPAMVVSWMSPSIAERALEADRQRYLEQAERRIARYNTAYATAFHLVDVDADAIARYYLDDVVQSQPADAPPMTPAPRALQLRRTRNTGPSTSARAPRTINPRRGR